MEETLFLDLMRDPLAQCSALALVLLPAALQDYRTRRVSPWLTLPLFFGAWPFSLLNNTSQLTLATFVGFYIAYHLTRGVGGADGKVAVALAAVNPLTLAAGLAINGLAFLYCRLRWRTEVRLPGVVGFYLGTVATVILEFGRWLQI